MVLVSLILQNTIKEKMAFQSRRGKMSLKSFDKVNLESNNPMDSKDRLQLKLTQEADARN